MPYIVGALREALDRDAGLLDLETYLSSSRMSEREWAGTLNYLVFRLTKKRIEKQGKSYFFFAVVVGTLVCCVLEIYRRLVAPYEGTKIQSNGDV